MEVNQVRVLLSVTMDRRSKMMTMRVQVGGAITKAAHTADGIGAVTQMVIRDAIDTTGEVTGPSVIADATIAILIDVAQTKIATIIDVIPLDAIGVTLRARRSVE